MRCLRYSMDMNKVKITILKTTVNEALAYGMQTNDDEMVKCFELVIPNIVKNYFI
jgi:hypothetical protein